MLADPRAACFYARRAVELAVHWIYSAEVSLSRPYKDDLSAMLFEPSFQRTVKAHDVDEDRPYSSAGQPGCA